MAEAEEKGVEVADAAAAATTAAAVEEEGGSCASSSAARAPGVEGVTAARPFPPLPDAREAWAPLPSFLDGVW